MDITKALTACRAGSLDAFGSIYDAFFRKIYDFVYYKTMDSAIAEDITSEVFIKALKAIGNFTGEAESDLKSWLYRIAHNSVIDYYRTKKDEVATEDIEEILGHEEDFSGNVDDKNKLEEVLEYLETIPSEQKQILIMRIWDDLSYAEIARITSKTTDNCKKIVSRLLAQISANVSFLIFILLLGK
jgi:RNA polymerase sigma-70 factor (ECF subfamily)